MKIRRATSHPANFSRPAGVGVCFPTRIPTRIPLRFSVPLPIIALIVAATVGTSACSTSWIPYFARPYRPDIQQGNVVTQDMVEQLRPGMTAEQVHFLLGTPMLQDIFHQDRWDYPYYLQRGNGRTQLRRLTVYFDRSGRLARFHSDKMPSETAADKMIIGKAAK